MRKKCFNMVEILLAMGVVAIGFMSVITLLSLGLQTHRQAQENSYVTLAAETMANFTRGESELYDLSEFSISTYSNNGITGHSLRTTKMTYYTIDTMYSSAFRHELEAGTQSLELPPPREFKECKFTKTLIPDQYTYDLSDSFTLMQSSKSNREFVKYHYLKWTTDINDKKVTDFDCIATIGFEPPHFPRTTSGEDLNGEEGNSRLTVRIEWPAEVPVEQRQSRIFHYMVY